MWGLLLPRHLLPAGQDKYSDSTNAFHVLDVLISTVEILTEFPLAFSDSTDYLFAYNNGGIKRTTLHCASVDINKPLFHVLMSFLIPTSYRLMCNNTVRNEGVKNKPIFCISV